MEDPADVTSEVTTLASSPRYPPATDTSPPKLSSNRSKWNSLNAKCLLCTKSFKRQWDLTRHMKTVHAGGCTTKPPEHHLGSTQHCPSMASASCPVCNKYISRKCDMKRHMRSVHKESNNIDTPSDITTDDLADINSEDQEDITSENLVDINTEDQLDIPDEDQVRTSASYPPAAGTSPPKHSSNRNWPSRAPASCPVCNRHFSQKCAMQRHMRRIHKHSNNRDTQADITGGDQATTAGSASKHSTQHWPSTDTYIHSEDPASTPPPPHTPVNCPICNINFSQKYVMERHMKLVHQQSLDDSTKSQNTENPCCGICSRMLSEWSEHVRTESGSDCKPYTCETCELSYTTTEQLIVHLYQVHHVQISVKHQLICIKVKQEPEDFESHFMSTSLEEDILDKEPHTTHDFDDTISQKSSRCPPETSASVGNYDPESIYGESSEHLKSYSEKPNHEEVSSVSDHSDLNEDFSSPEKDYRPPHVGATCLVCMKSFTRKWDLTRHMKNIHGASPQNSNSGLQKSNHEEVNTISKNDGLIRDSSPEEDRDEGAKWNYLNAKCHLCTKSFKRQWDLTRHMKTVHGGEPPHHHLCSHCGKSFKHLSVLACHIRVHTGEKPFICEVCGKAFITASKLKYHRERLHEKIKKHTCEECGYQTYAASNMTAHKRIHTGEKPYMCEYCSKSYSQRYTLTEHVRIAHTRRNLAQCSICSKELLRSGMKRHMMWHQGEKPYSCKYCSKTFFSSSHRKKHERTHTGEKKGYEKKAYKCKVCWRTFGRLSYLKKHMEEHNQTSVETENFPQPGVQLTEDTWKVPEQVATIGPSQLFYPDVNTMPYVALDMNPRY